MAVLWGCGPELGDADVFPNNCGAEGPVDLMELSAGVHYLDVQRAGDHYLVGYSWDGESIETYAVDRCGRDRVLVHELREGTTTRVTAGGEHALSCDEDTGQISYVDASGVEPPRSLFPDHVEGCRVVPFGRGLAAQQKEGGTVWFHPDPADPSVEPIVVTDSARLANPSWLGCYFRFDCDSWHPHGVDITAAGDELLVVLDSDELLAFSTTTHADRIVDEGPVQAMDVLTGAEHVVVRRKLGPNLVIERETGTTVEFCCYDDIEPIHRFGDWLVKGSLDSPILPKPPAWTTFKALHLPSGTLTEVSGNEAWHVVAPLTADTIVARIGPPWDVEGRAHYVVHLATGERRRVDLPGELAWAVPGVDGVFTVQDDLNPRGLHYLAGPDQSPRALLGDVTIDFPTTRGRIVFHEGVREEYEPPKPLSVMLPDERIVQLDARVTWTMAPPPWDRRWVSDTDEVVYVAQDDEGHWMLRRTVLP